MLEAFSAEHWDFRGGRERNLAAAADLSAEQERSTIELAPGLGMAPSRPLRQDYDAIVMTGGMVRAGIVKPRFARELLDAGVRARSIVFLGAFRAFAGDEHALARALGVRGEGEFDAMDEGMRRAFGVNDAPVFEGDDAHRPEASWRRHSWPAVGKRPALEVLAAASSDPARGRANTVDTYRFWAERQQAQAVSVLVVTTPIYVPYQAAGAIEVLGMECGFSVEAVGVSSTASDLGALSQPFLAQHHLQELRSGIRGMASLLRRAGR